MWFFYITNLSFFFKKKLILHIATIVGFVEQKVFFKKITFSENKHVTKQIKLFYIYSIMAAILSWEEIVAICDLNYDILFHPMKFQSLFLSLRLNLILKVSCLHEQLKTNHQRGLSALSRPENMMSKYAVAILKDTRVVGHLTKEKSGQYTIFPSS